MAEKYIIAADRSHLRIYRYSQEPGQFTPSIQPVDALDLPEGRDNYLDDDRDMAGRFPGAMGRGRGMSIGERLPLEREKEGDVIELLAERIGLFMEQHPNATWDLAANSALYNELVDALPDPVRRRLNQVVSKDLVNVPPAELREHFTLR
jgi:protein required for attachment to host cells